MTRTVATISVALTAGLSLAACGSSGNNGSTGSSGSSGSVPKISISSLTRNFTAMSTLKGLAAKGKGNVGVILPDTVTSARYTEFDAPYLTEALTVAGLTPNQFSVQNAQGSDPTELADAQEDITKGASVLIMDPLDSGIGAQIESYAKKHGVAVIDYDRLTLGGTRQYYVSFNNVHVGTLLGDGLKACVAAWHVSHPNVLVMYGAPTDNNATQFGQGYNAVLNPLFSAGQWSKVGSAPGTWDPPTAETEFQQQYTAHHNINALLAPNDENAGPIIQYLQRQKVKPNTFPVTGQDATLVGLQNILSGYQCGTVYKPIFLEAQAAAAVALYVRAGLKPPTSLVNNSVTDPQSKASVPSVLLTPEWVTQTNMENTVIKDNFVPAQQLCVGSYAAECTKYGIKV